MAYTYNLSTLGGQGRKITWGQEFKTSLGNMAKPISTKNTKISQACWHAPAVPATQEAEAGESLKPGRGRLQWAVIAPLHSSLSDRVRHRLKQTNKKKQNRSRKKTKHLKRLFQNPMGNVINQGNTEIISTKLRNVTGMSALIITVHQSGGSNRCNNRKILNYCYKQN